MMPFKKILQILFRNNVIGVKLNSVYSNDKTNKTWFNLYVIN